MGGHPTKSRTINGVGELNLNTSTVQSCKEDNKSRTSGRINYNYDMKYLLSLSIRYDGSSHFAETTSTVHSRHLGPWNDTPARLSSKTHSGSQQLQDSRPLG